MIRWPVRVLMPVFKLTALTFKRRGWASRTAESMLDELLPDL